MASFLILNYLSSSWLNSLKIHPLILKLIIKVLRKFVTMFTRLDLDLQILTSEQAFLSYYLKLLETRNLMALQRNSERKKYILAHNPKLGLKWHARDLSLSGLFDLTCKQLMQYISVPQYLSFFYPSPKTEDKDPMWPPPPYVLIIQTPLIDVILHTLAT